MASRAYGVAVKLSGLNFRKDGNTERTEWLQRCHLAGLLQILKVIPSQV